MTADIDPNRIPHEITRALDAACVLVDALDPGLSLTMDDPDALGIIDAHGTYLASLPRYRIADVDEAAIGALIRGVVDSLPVDLGDQLRADVEAGRAAMVCPAETEWIYLYAHERIIGRFHRSWVVPSWPTEDLPPGLTPVPPTEDQG